MFKLFVLFAALCLASYVYAAPSLSGHGHLPILTSSSSISSSSYHNGWPSTVRVVRPIWTTRSIVRPIIHGNLGLNGGYGYGHGWI